MGLGFIARASEGIRNNQRVPIDLGEVAAFGVGEEVEA